MKSNKLNLACIFLIYSLDSFGIAIAYPIFTPIFLNDHSLFFADSTSIIYRTLSLGFLLAMFPIAQFISVPFIGDFSDRIGRKKTFAFTLIGSTLSYLLAAFSIFIYSVPLLCISRLCSGMFAGNTSLCFASLSDLSTTDQERSKNFGLMAAFGGISFFLSILSGEYFFNNDFTSEFAASMPFIIIAFLSAATLLFMIALFHDVKSPKKRAKFHLAQGYHHIVATLRSKTLRSPYLVYFFFAMGWSAMAQFYPAILFKVYNKTPIAFTVNLLSVGIIWSLANFVAQRYLAKNFTPKQVLWATIPLLFFSLLSCIPEQSYLSFSLHFSLSIFAAALTWTNTFANVSLHAPKGIQGRIMGINQSFSAIATILAALGGALFASIDPSCVLIFSTICTFFSLIFLRTKKTISLQ
jgi:MFS transporter, DHA1 family, tetracycline resistance protein